MATLAVYLVVGVLTIVILLVVWRYALAYSNFRGVRLVTCPETAKPAAVEVDAKHAALRGVFGKLNLQAERLLALARTSGSPARVFSTNRGCSGRLFGSQYLDQVASGKIMRLLREASGTNGMGKA